MKIASFAFRSYPAKGGVELHQKLIGEFLASKGHEFTVYTSRMEDASEYANISFKFPFIKFPSKKSNLKIYETINGVNYKRFEIRFRIYSYNQMKLLYKTFKKDIVEYDLVHLQGLNVYNNYRLAKIAFKNKKPVILSCYDISIPENLPFFTRLFKKIYDQVFVKRLNKYVSEFLVLTEDQILELEKIGIAKNKIRVWSAGFDISKYKPKYDDKKILKKYNLVEEKYIFNFGRIEEYKGVQDILQIAIKNTDLKFVIGGKDEGYLSTLNKIKAKFKIDNVFLLGELNDVDATVLLRNAHIFVFPSKKEGWGIVLAEAMSVGIPCIAYNITNVRTVFTDGKSGVLANNIEEMEKAIIKLMKNNQLRKTMSKYATNEAKKYDYKKNITDLEKIYRKYLTVQ